MPNIRHHLPSYVVVVATATLAGGLLTAAASPEGHSIASADLVPELERTQDASDRLPPDAASVADELSVVQSSTRLIGENRLGTFWVAESSAGEMCVVSATDDQSMSSTVCRPRDQFYRHGISNQFGGDKVSTVEVHLLPEGVEAASLAQVSESLGATTNERGLLADDEQISVLGDSRLLVLDGEASKAMGEVHLSRDEGEDVTLPDLSPRS